MPTDALTRIRELLIEAELEPALEAFDQWAQISGQGARRADIALWLGDLRRSTKEFTQGLVSDTDLRIVHQRITKGVLDLLDELGDGRNAIHDFHCYTCDRVDQSDTFTELFEKQRAQRTQFYFLYGWEPQSHLGMFRRIAYEKEGALISTLGQGATTGARARQLELRLPESRKETVLKLNIVRNLFRLLEVVPEQHEPILERNLAYLAGHSPMLKELSAQDYCCLYMPILSIDWDSQMTPAVARWLFEEFCKGELPENCPTFLFFFAVIFEEEDAALVAEIRDIVEKSEHIFPLPELEKVERRDIRRWFSIYQQLAPTSEARDALMNAHFNSLTNAYDMEIVELNLRKIIDQYNNDRIG